jgi:hypothetical protein
MNSHDEPVTFKTFMKIKPQIKAPRVAPLEGASTYALARAYVSMHCGGHDADERRFAESYPRSFTVNTSNPVLLID